MYSTEWIEKWSEALLDKERYPQHFFNKKEIVQPICMKYGDGSWTVIGVLVDVIFQPAWVAYYAPGEMPPIAGIEPWFSEAKKKAKVFCYGAMGSAGPIPERVLNQGKFYPSFYNFISTQNYQNDSFQNLSAAIKNYNPEDWKEKESKK